MVKYACHCKPELSFDRGGHLSTRNVRHFRGYVTTVYAAGCLAIRYKILPFCEAELRDAITLLSSMWRLRGVARVLYCMHEERVMSKWKRLGEPLLQFVILAVSTLIAIIVVPRFLESKREFLKSIWITDEKTLETTIIPFLISICYFIFWACYEVINIFTDKRRIFRGAYLGLPQDPRVINIFKIEFKNGKFVLIGYRFSLSTHSSPLSGVTGSWSSEQLEMTTLEPLRLIYNYLGEQHKPMKLSGRGFVSIRFNGKTTERGHGSWVSLVDSIKPSEARYSNYVKLTDSVSAEFTDSNYVKVTPDIMKMIMKRAFYFDSTYPYLHIRRFVREPISIFTAFAALPESERVQGPFQRPVNQS